MKIKIQRLASATAFLLCVLTTIVSASTIHPKDGVDAFDSYFVSNRLQCQRLCWYRQLCYSFSYTENADNFIPENANCVLHAPAWHLQGLLNDPENQPPEGWTETVPDGDSVTNACADRPCFMTTVCVPVPPGNSSKCLPYPVVCDPPQPPLNAVVKPTGFGVGAVAYVGCKPGFEMTPKDAPPYNQLQCLIIRRWSLFKGVCEPTIN